MTEEEARQSVGAQTNENFGVVCDALPNHTAENTDRGWLRLEAACLLLGELAPAEAVAVLKAHKALRGEIAAMTADAAWNDRVALYCLSLILMRGDQTILDPDVPGYLRFQVDAARQAGVSDIADALDQSADAYEQGHHSLAYSILLDAIVPPEAPET